MAALCGSSAICSPSPVLMGRRSGRTAVMPIRCSMPASLSVESVVDRRQVMVAAATATLLGWTPSATAATATGVEEATYTDPENQFSLQVPAGWESGEGLSGSRRVVGFYPKGDSVTNVSLVITILGADYTGVSSFGRVEDFSENLVNSLDRSWKRPPGQRATLVKATASNDMFFVNYSVQPAGEATRQLVSAVAVKRSGFYNRLYTLTGQYLESDSAKFEATIKRVVSTFRLL